MISLAINHLSFAYTDRIIVQDANVHITSTGITCITGSNGSGKSTFLRLLHGLIKPDSGDIQWISHAPPKIGMVFQKPLMLRRSVLANIQFTATLAKNSTDPLVYLQLLQLEHLAKKPARSLSGGEQQKLAIARILAWQPDVLLLDEPTAHLDPHTTLKIEQLLLDLSAQGKKLFLVSHDMRQVQRLAQDKLHLEEGQIH